MQHLKCILSVTLPICFSIWKQTEWTAADCFCVLTENTIHKILPNGRQESKATRGKTDIESLLKSKQKSLQPLFWVHVLKKFMELRKPCCKLCKVAATAVKQLLSLFDDSVDGKWRSGFSQKDTIRLESDVRRLFKVLHNLSSCYGCNENVSIACDRLCCQRILRQSKAALKEKGNVDSPVMHVI